MLKVITDPANRLRMTTPIAFVPIDNVLESTALKPFIEKKTFDLSTMEGEFEAYAALTAGVVLTGAFANGGIVSGPTMGLVGEYPGAANNPEVIAPLDKLKSMIGGGGGGTFVLRGQDLLLATNRAQKASNLKGQNISLA